ncbi:MAG: ATP-binding protein [Spirochaetaceae bacterium]
MISRILLPRYGCFTDASFDLGQVTVFTGPNESGKSTIFDALFDAITEAPGTHGKVKANTGRYGKERRVVLEGSLPSPAISPEEFLSILAVDSGDLTVPEGRGPWLDRLKAQLFTDGVDPGGLARELAAEATERKNARHMRELQSLIERRGELVGAHQRALERRSEMVRRRKEADTAASRRGSLEGRLTTVVAARKAAETSLAAVEQQWRRRQIGRALGEIGDLTRIEGELAQASLPGEEALRELEALSKRRDDALSALGEGAREVEALRTRLDEATLELTALESESGALRHQIAIAQNLRGILEAQYGSRALIRKTVTTGGGVALILLSAAGGILFPGGAQTLWLSAGGVLLGLLLLLLGLRRRGPKFADIRDRWAAATGKPPLSEGVEGLRRELSGIESVLQHLEGQLSEARRTVEQCSKNVRDAETRARELEEKHTGATTLVDRWLSEHRVSTPGEAARRGQERRDLEQRRSLLREHLKPWQEELGVRDLGALQEELRAQLGSLDPLSAHGGVDESDVPNLRRRVAELESEEQTLREEIRRLDTEEKSKRATYSEVYAGLPEQILAIERELEATESRIAEVDRRRRASAIASKIFEGLSADATIQLGGLAQELGTAYRDITGSEALVVLESMDAKEASAVDAGGITRNIADLSQGTKDVLMWTFRVAMAKKARPEPAILVLDDPFLAVDKGRIGKCLLLLRDSLISEGWQVVLLTKDRSLGEAATTLHPKSVLYELNRPGAGADT